jgi:hypothetical protein
MIAERDMRVIAAADFRCQRCGFADTWNARRLEVVKVGGKLVVLCDTCRVRPVEVPEFMGHRDWYYGRVEDYLAQLRHFRKALHTRDRGRCGLCGKFVDLYAMDVDHIIPKSMGGPDHWDNLQVAHPRCNRSRGNRILSCRLPLYYKASAGDRVWHRIYGSGTVVDASDRGPNEQIVQVNFDDGSRRLMPINDRA